MPCTASLTVLLVAIVAEAGLMYVVLRVRMNEEATTAGRQEHGQKQRYGYGQHRLLANWLPSMSIRTGGEFTTNANERIFCSRRTHFYSHVGDPSFALYSALDPGLISIGGLGSGWYDCGRFPAVWNVIIAPTIVHLFVFGMRKRKPAGGRARSRLSWVQVLHPEPGIWPYGGTRSGANSPGI